jgi:hypothetical protein
MVGIKKSTERLKEVRIKRPSFPTINVRTGFPPSKATV